MLNVLIVEDLPDYQAEYRALLEGEGYTCTTVSTREQAAAAWRAGRYDVVLLDKRLQGLGGSDDGIDLLREVRFTTAKVILVTAYAEPDSVVEAYALGAYDYLQKDDLLPTLLKVKLDLVRELVRARDRGQPEGEAKIQALWADLRAGDAHAKGRQLEELLLRIFTSVPGFKETGHRVRTHTEELDIVIRNEAADKFWQKLSTYFLVECKNWSKRVGTPEMAWFADKVRERPGSLGFFAAPEGFSEAVDEKLRSYRKEGLHVLTLDRVDLDSLVRTPDRNELLKTIHARSVTG